jgi:hypothetical protein
LDIEVDLPASIVVEKHFAIEGASCPTTQMRSMDESY